MVRGVEAELVPAFVARGDDFDHQCGGQMPLRRVARTVQRQVRDAVVVLALPDADSARELQTGRIR